MEKRDKISIVFFATPKIAVKSLEHLLNAEKIDVLAVVTQPDKPSGRGQKINFSPIKKLAQKFDIEILQPISIKKDKEVIERLKKINPDFFVTFAFGQILSKEVLDIPKYSTINLHASLLPLYRGANPIQRAIINGDKKTGICTMITEEGLDCGGVCLKDEIEITENMNFVELFELISEKSPELIEQTLMSIKSGAIIPVEQCHKSVTFANKIKKEEARINWEKTAREIHNLVRGIYKYPSAHAYFKGKFIKIKKTTIYSDENVYKNPGEIIDLTPEGILIGTSGGIIQIEKVKPEGKQEMDSVSWANGLGGAKKLVGECFE